jgi:hypothetical protein
VAIFKHISTKNSRCFYGISSLSGANNDRTSTEEMSLLAA